MATQTCPHCNSTNFEEQDGILYCTNCSRQLEGGYQLVADDPEFGTQGKITRQKLTRTKVKVTQTYRGKRAYRLYLHAWQHILWKQCHALIASGAPEQLWDVVRDLWGLRLSVLVGRLDDDASEGEQGTNAYVLPKLYDTVALVYLAAMLVRFPVPLGRLFGMIVRQEICFVRAIHFVPYDISSHLPPEYQEALDTSVVPTAREFQKHVTSYVLKSIKEYGMSVPPLNWRVLLFEWIEELALPIEIMPAVEKLAGFLEFDFVYKVSEKRRNPVANPETQLACLIVIAAKFMFPLSGSSFVDTNGLAMNWTAWLDAHRAHADEERQRKTHHKPEQCIKMNADDVASAEPAILDEYMDWYEKMFVSCEQAIEHKKSELEMKILDMFPLVARPSTSANLQPDIGDPQDTLVHVVQRSAMATSARPAAMNGDEAETEQTTYTVVADVQALRAMSSSEAHNSFLYLHERTAELACLSLKQLLKAVRHTERRIEKWIAQRRREELLATLEDD